MNLAVSFLLVVAIVLLNAWATYAIFQDTLASPRQRAAQLAVVWLVPLLGSALTLYLKHAKPEPPTGYYREPRDPGDDFAYSGRSVRQAKEVLNNDHHSSGEAGAND